MDSRVLGVILGGCLFVACGDDESTARPDVSRATESGTLPTSPPANCVSPTGALSTSSIPRQTLPWTLELSAASAGDNGTGELPDNAAGAGGVGSTTTSGCQTETNLGTTSTDCEGLVAVEAGGAGPSLIFDDGSRLTWDTTGFQEPLELELDGKPWVSYGAKTTGVCPFCGTFSEQSITVRAHEGGQLLFVARQGHRIDDVTDSALVLELFGVYGVARPRCSYSARAGCYTYDRTELDHALLTEPEQFIPGATLTRVATDNGDYDVLWAHSEETNIQLDPLCADGPIDAHDTGFLAIRRD